MIRRWTATAGVVGFAALPQLRSRPHRAYRLLRALDPIHESPIGIWVLSGHREVADALRHPDLGSDETKADPSAIRLGPVKHLLSAPPAISQGGGSEAHKPADPVRQMLRQLMLFRDPPDHTRLRSLVNKAFTTKASVALEARIAELAHARLDQIEPRREMDFLAEIAYPVPAIAICELIGVPSSDHDVIISSAPAIAARLDPSPMRNPAAIAAAASAAETLTGYLSELIAERKARPKSDLLSAMIAAEHEGGRLDHDELVGMAVLLLLAGHETTANLLGNGLLALLSHPTRWAQFRTDPSIDRTAVEELLRFAGPIQVTERTTLDVVDIGGVLIPRGRIVVLCLAAANRDPAVFDSPDVLDLERDPNPHLSFGSGPHFCLGAGLARLEARTILRAVADRLPNLELGGGRPRWRPSFTIRGLRELRLTW